MAMDDGKKAAKEFVNKYFPQKQQPQKLGVFDSLFAPPESALKQSYGGQNSSAQFARTDKKTVSSPSKGQSRASKSSTAAESGEGPASCLAFSAVDYGSRDNFYPPSQQSGSSYKEKKDTKEAYDYTDPENSRGEWWQGSLYY